MNADNVPNEELDFTPCGDLCVDEGGEGIRHWSDDVEFFKAPVEGGHLYLAVRTGDVTHGMAMTFVPNKETS